MNRDPDASRPPPQPTPRPPLNLAELSTRCMDNGAIARMLLEKFEAQLRRDLPEIERLAGAGDSARIAGIAHGLKGAAAAIAAHQLRELAAQIESHARTGRLDQIGLHVTALALEAERFAAFLPEARESLGSARPVRVSMPGAGP